MAGALIQPDAFTRADVIDSELDWPSGLAIGRLAKLWTKTQNGNGISVAKRRLILQWAEVEPEHASRFLELCCLNEKGRKIHFLEPRDDGCYFIVGNPEQIEKISVFSARASAGGHAKAEKARAARLADSASSRTSSMLEAAPQAEDKQCFTSAKTLPLSLSLPSPKSKPKSDRQSDRPYQHPRTQARTRVDPTQDGRPVGQGGEGLSPEGLIGIWNDFRAEAMPECRRLTAAQQDAASAALTAHPEPSYWQARMKQLVESPFANGKQPTPKFPNGWVASIGYLIRRHEDIAAGAIDPHGRSGRRALPPPPACSWCADRGSRAAWSDDGTLSFRCSECAAGKTAKYGDEYWDDAKHGAKWKLCSPIDDGDDRR